MRLAFGRALRIVTAVAAFVLWITIAVGIAAQMLNFGIAGLERLMLAFVWLKGKTDLDVLVLLDVMLFLTALIMCIVGPPVTAAARIVSNAIRAGLAAIRGSEVEPIAHPEVSDPPYKWLGVPMVALGFSWVAVRLDSLLPV